MLALDAVRAMKPQLDFLTPLAFAVILLTNVLVLLAAIRAKDLVLEVAAAPVAVRVLGNHSGLANRPWQVGVPPAI